MKELRADIEALAKLRGSTATSDAERQEGRSLAAQASALKDAERGWRGVNEQATRAKSSLSGLSEAMTGFGKSAVGGAGLGSFGSILTAGSITAAVAAVGVIVGQSVRMAYEFERASTRAAQQLSIGFGGDLSANVATLQRAARSGRAYNVSDVEMSQAIATYGASSGSGIRGAVDAAPQIAQYARAYGLEPQMVAQTIGQAVAMTGRSFGGEARGLFGAAEDAGNLGRRLPEFIQASTSMLARMQAASPGTNYGIGDAAALIANVSKLGGYYGTGAGAASFFNAGQGLMSGISTDPAKMSFAIGAGMSQRDIMLERDTPNNERLAMQYAARLSGGNEYAMKYMLNKQGVSSGDALKALDALFDPQTGAVRDPRGLSHGIDALYRTNTPGQANEAARVAGRAAQYQNSELGDYEKLFTSIQNKELALGQTILGALAKTAGQLGDFINGPWTNIGTALTAALALNTLALLARGGGGGGLLSGLRGLLGRGAGAAGGALEAVEGAGGAAGAGGLLAGAGALAGGAAVTGGLFYGLYKALGGDRLSQTRDFHDLAMSGLSEDAARSLATNQQGFGGGSLFSRSQQSALAAAARKYNIPVGLLAGLTLQEHGGAVSNRDQVGGGGRGWFQIDTGSHMDWLKSHNMGHDFSSAAEYAASLVADAWHSTHSVDAVGEVYNGGHIGAKTTVNDRGTYEQGLKTAVSQAVSAGVGSTTIPDGHGGHVIVKVTAQHVAAKKPTTQSRIATR